MKGITPVIAVILLLLITISIVGIAFTFFQRTTQAATQSGEQQLEQQINLVSGRLVIESVTPSAVYLRNVGARDVSSYNVYSNNRDVTGLRITIPVNQVAKVPVQLLLPGSNDVRVSSGVFADTRTATLDNSAYLLADDFTDGDYNGWTLMQFNPPVACNWFVANGILHEVTDACDGFLKRDLDNRDSYSISVDMGVADGFNNAVGVGFSIQDANNYYYFIWQDPSDHYGPDQATFYAIARNSGGSLQHLARVDNAALVPGVFENIKIVVDKNKIKVFRNSLAILEATVPDPSVPLRNIGLYTWDNDFGAMYDNIFVS